ncbi:MAG TPA: hypothetical protein VIO64_09970 [Pseudobacteroides sp.]|uniref:hypothetical protein n=1 Tax=Pseudobacteroides sp. TaxID=1968840 RepID=UPI002F91F4A5
MVRAILYKLITFCIFLFILINFTLTNSFAQPTTKNKIAIRPAIVDLGAVDAKQYTTEINVVNMGSTCTISPKVEGKGSECITVFPSTFKLLKGETKNIKVIIDSTSIKIGAYDLSILFISDNPDEDPNGLAKAKGETSFRLKFSKPGIAIASFNVVDVEKPKNALFYIIYANFLHSKSYVNSNIKIISLETNEVVAEFNEKVSMNPYPQAGFYGTLKIPFTTEDVEMGKYFVKVDSISPDGKRLNAEKAFKVGLLRGELISVNVEDVYKGQMAHFKAEVKNTGNLDLNTSLKVIVKNEKGQKIFPDKCSMILPPGIEQNLIVKLETDKLDSGLYTAEYEVKYGNKFSTGNLVFNILPNSNFLIIIVVSLLNAIILFLIIFLYFVKIKNRNKLC